MRFHKNRSATNGRGFGPFSGAQLTLIIVVGLLTVMLPVAAFAKPKGDNVFVTDAVTGKQAQVNASGQMLVGVKAVSGLISQGTVDVDSFTSSALFTNVDVKNYSNVRLILGQTGADPAAQTVTVLSGLQPYVLDNFVMNTANVTRLYPLPGLNISLSVANNDANSGTATYTWRLFGRP